MENNMWIKRIKVNNFRNYKQQEIVLEENINLLVKMHKEKQIL